MRIVVCISIKFSILVETTIFRNALGVHRAQSGTVDFRFGDLMIFQV